MEATHHAEIRELLNRNPYASTHAQHQEEETTTMWKRSASIGSLSGDVPSEAETLKRDKVSDLTGEVPAACED